MIIAVDGESASGKGTVSKIISQKLSLKYLDTGLLYRGLAYLVNDYKDTMDDSTVLKLASILNVENLPKSLLKTDEIAQLASTLAQNSQVRTALKNYQTNFIIKHQKQGVILDGRDIGTVICPYADLKFYICASLEVRAKRRYVELSKSNPKITLEEIKKSLFNRDFQDKNRTVGALKKSNDAICIDTSNLTIIQVVDKMLYYISKISNTSNENN